MVKSGSKFILSLCLMLLLPGLCYGWQGKVVGVSEGDIITVLHDGKEEIIRLYGIDAPEKHQDFGEKAKKFTSDAVFGKMVNVKPIDRDQYGRTVGIVVYDGMNLNVELIRSGHAWVYDEYCTRPDCKVWDFIEAKARDEENGLWSMPNPIPPWEFRHPGERDQNGGSGPTDGR